MPRCNVDHSNHRLLHVQYNTHVRSVRMLYSIFKLNIPRVQFPLRDQHFDLYVQHVIHKSAYGAHLYWMLVQMLLHRFTDLVGSVGVSIQQQVSSEWFQCNVDTELVSVIDCKVM